MIHPKKEKMTPRQRRARRVRKKVFGTTEAPRLSVHRSLKNIRAQLIDDVKGVSLLGVSSEAKEFRSRTIEGGKVAA